LSLTQKSDIKCRFSEVSLSLQQLLCRLDIKEIKSKYNNIINILHMKRFRFKKFIYKYIHLAIVPIWHM